MKQIINGKLYSTDAASLKHYWDNGKGETQADMDEYEAESLYRTKSGEYFLWITEGCINSKIKPVSLEGAFDWLESVNADEEEITKALNVELA
jgi:hypothetical protein